jgi:hypothetical protein
MRNAGVEPLEAFPGSNSPWRSRCNKCSSEVTPRYSTVSRGLGACNVCAKFNAAKVRSDEAQLRLRESLKLRGIEPVESYQGMHVPWLVRCETCQHEWRPKPYSLANGRGCPECKRRNAGTKQREGHEPKAMQLMIEARLRPLTPYPGMTKPWLSECLQCGSLVRPRAAGISVGQGGCTKCGVVRSANSRRTPISVAYQEMISAGVQPNDQAAFVNVDTAWPGICLKCGLRVSPALASIRSGQSGCRRCAMVGSDSSFDFFGESIFYLISLPNAGAGKIGIAGASTSRLKDHRRHGWVVNETMKISHGYDAWYLEGTVLSWLRADLLIPAALTDADMPQGGYTETFDLGSIELEDVWAHVQRSWQNRAWSVPSNMDSGRQKGRRGCSLAGAPANCGKPYFALGYCKNHYRAFRLYGDPEIRRRKVFQNETCEVIEARRPCGRVTSKKGMCSVHYYRDYVHGDPLELRRPTPKPLPSHCEVEDCDGKPYSLGLCSKHYHAQRRSLGKR